MPAPLPGLDPLGGAYRQYLDPIIDNDARLRDLGERPARISRRRHDLTVPSTGSKTMGPPPARLGGASANGDQAFGRRRRRRGRRSAPAGRASMSPTARLADPRQLLPDNFLSGSLSARPRRSARRRSGYASGTASRLISTRMRRRCAAGGARGAPLGSQSAAGGGRFGHDRGRRRGRSSPRRPSPKAATARAAKQAPHTSRPLLMYGLPSRTARDGGILRLQARGRRRAACALLAARARQKTTVRRLPPLRATPAGAASADDADAGAGAGAGAGRGGGSDRVTGWHRR